MTARMPTFLMIGAAKAGTTSLYAQLRSHPDVFMSAIKEPNYFAFAGHENLFKGIRIGRTDPTVVTAPERYRALFAGATTETAIGEASVVYLYLPWCAERIERELPDVRLVVMLRNPVERAFSQYLHALRDGFEDLSSFDDALDAEPRRISENETPMLHYAAQGLYHEQLARYYRTFDRDRIRVYLYDDYGTDPSAILRDLYSFLGVDPAHAPDTSRTYNESGVPKSRLLYGTFTSLVAAVRRGASTSPVGARILHSELSAKLSARATSLLLAKPPMPERARARLTEFYRDDVSRLEGLIGRDLSAWK
jgi:hypothetical protein